MSINSQFDMVIDTPDLLYIWWGRMCQEERKKISCHLGNLTSIMTMKGCRELIEVIIRFWDRDWMVFHFGNNIEIASILEELKDVITSVGLGLKRRKKHDDHVLIPEKPTYHQILKIISLSHDNWAHGQTIPFRELYKRFSNPSAFVEHPAEFETYAMWEVTRPLAFSICFLGLMVFPKDGTLAIDTRVISGTHAIFYGITRHEGTKYFYLTLIILADMYRALSLCTNQYKYFHGCNLLLQWWILKHMIKFRPNFGDQTKQSWTLTFSRLMEDGVQWMFDDFVSDTVVVKGRKCLFLPLMWIRGIHLYVPSSVSRQFGST
ncbi:uncharacterized protein LOC132636025 [Lycium barbarum]|uniref:uncharacterized protein LOC132636025 n=1 Tax=Lycium barbarum TaxID=112863 RepID=UPI00293F16F8|nr:uncharacterized protein LOC132636025 [Lycium barbarum]XP_060208660.1 uncharacterized protein LOC132636025 [Lycium barbarum]XP_060208661.1 uncharacterized protein LOC132636025 [Lycium barbarum]